MKKYILGMLLAGVLTGTGCKKQEAAQAPQPFNAVSGVVMGPVSAIDQAKNEIVIGDNLITVSPADAARLKVGDEVTVEVHDGKIAVRKAGEKAEPAPFSGLTGHEMGPIEALDAVKNELTVNSTIFKLKPADLAGLKVGDRVKVTVAETGITVALVK